MEFNIGKSLFVGSSLGSLDHLGRHIDADSLSGRPDFGSGEEDINAATTAQIDDDFTRFDMGGGSWVTARQTHVSFGRNVREFLGAVAECFSNGTNAGVLVREAARCHGGVFLFDFFN